MITTKARSPGKYITLVRHGANSAPYQGQTPQLGMLPAREEWQTVVVPPLSELMFDGLGNARVVPIHRARSVFNLLPNPTSASAGKDDLFVTLATGTIVVARAAKGGINVKTQVTTPATGDSAIVTGLANNGTNVPLAAATQPRLVTRVSLSQITLQLFSATLDETITAVDPTASAGDGAGFVFDPTNALSSGLASAVYTNNWLLYQKVAGADTFTDSGVAVAAGVDYDLDVGYDVNLVPFYLINGDLIPNALAVAGTSGHTLGTLVGVKIIDAGTPVQHDFDLRYVQVERFIG